jgi:hypothetical protein
MKHPVSPATIGAPLMRYPGDEETFRVPHITTTQNNKTGEQIARTEINGKVYEARHPSDSGRAAQALGEHVAELHRRGELVTGII